MFINSWKSWLFLYSWISWPLNVMGRHMFSADCHGNHCFLYGSYGCDLGICEHAFITVMQACFHSCTHGWWNLLACRYVSESTAAVAISFVLYFYPSTPPAIFAGRRLAGKPSSDKNIAGTVEWFLLFSTNPWLYCDACVCGGGGGGGEGGEDRGMWS